MWQKIKVNKGGPRAPLCSVQCSSQWQSAAGAGSSQVHQSSLARAAAALWPALVVLLLHLVSNLTPTLPPAPGRPACCLIHTAPIDFAAADPVLSSLGTGTALHRNWALH